MLCAFVCLRPFPPLYEINEAARAPLQAAREAVWRCSGAVPEHPREGCPDAAIAFERLDEIRNRWGTFGNVLGLRAQVLALHGDAQGAVETVAEMLAIDPAAWWESCLHIWEYDTASAQSLVAQLVGLLEREGAYTEAREVLVLATRWGEHSVRLTLLLARIEARLGNRAAALATLGQADEPLYADGLTHFRERARVHLVLGDHDAARRELDAMPAYVQGAEGARRVQLEARAREIEGDLNL